MPRVKYIPPTEGGKSALSPEDQEKVNKLQEEIIAKETEIDEIYNKS